jgi:lambda family phage minor tail protein L
MIPNSPSIARDNQGLEPGVLVTLFQIDFSPLGVIQTFCFTSHGECAFQGIAYQALDVETEGWEYNGQGIIPQPKIRISNVTRLFSGSVLAYNDCIGAKVTRIRTYEKYLDGQPDADPSAFFAPDMYVVEQKTAHDRTMIEWTMSSSMDQQGRMVPGRQVIRDICMWRYRVWSPQLNDFDYSNASCPYVGAAMYDQKGDGVVDPVKDDCSHRINTGCKKRFGENAVLPFGGFPGVARVRT